MRDGNKPQERRQSAYGRGSHTGNGGRLTRGYQRRDVKEGQDPLRQQEGRRLQAARRPLTKPKLATRPPTGYKGTLQTGLQQQDLRERGHRRQGAVLEARAGYKATNTKSAGRSSNRTSMTISRTNGWKQSRRKAQRQPTAPTETYNEERSHWEAMDNNTSGNKRQQGHQQPVQLIKEQEARIKRRRTLETRNKPFVTRPESVSWD